MSKNSIKIIIGGPLGILAWSASAGSMLIIFFWGLEKSALAVIAVKTVSWGMWGVGVIRESAHFDALENRLKKIRQARRLCSCYWWSGYLYLCSLGARGWLSWRETSGCLQFYYVYYLPSIPGATPSLLAEAGAGEAVPRTASEGFGLNSPSPGRLFLKAGGGKGMVDFCSDRFQID